MDQYKQLWEDSKSYLKTRYDLLRLELLDKLSLILGILVLVIVAIFLALAAIAYFSVALVGWMGNVMPVAVACCILGGVFVIALITIYLLRERIFINPFVKMLSSILFSEPEAQDTEEGKTKNNTVAKEVKDETHV